jgi:3-methyladenine DNA glycosylase Mpg
MDHCEKKVDLTKAVNDGERIDISTTKTYLWKFLTWGDVNVLF